MISLKNTFCYRKNRFVLHSYETRTRIFAHQSIILRIFVVSRDTIRCKHIRITGCFVEDFRILKICSDRESEIRRERPWGRGPSEDIFARSSFDFEFHRHRLVLLVLIPLIDLEIGERSGAARTVWNNTIGLVHIALVVNVLKHPPYGFHEVRIHGLVIVVHIDPTTRAFDHLSPIVHISKDIPATFFVELIDSDLFFDIFLPRYSELLLDDVLDWETVTVPSESSLDELALHGLVPRDHILDRPCEEVTVVRGPGRKRRTVVEIELRSSLADFERFFESIVCFPIREHLFFESRERLTWVYLWKHSE